MTKDSSLEKDAAVSHQWATLVAAGGGAPSGGGGGLRAPEAASTLLQDVSFPLLVSPVSICIASSDLSSSLRRTVSVIPTTLLFFSLRFQV